VRFESCSHYLAANETFQPTTRGISQHIDKLKKTPGHASAGTTWTAARDESLLLLLVQELKIDFASLPQKWAAKYRESSCLCAVHLFLTTFRSK
jgi:hypothetical protein